MGLITPKETRSPDRIVFIDQFPVRKIQDFSVTPNFNNTEMSELGSDAIIESVADLITTQVSLNTYFDGMVDLFQVCMGEKANHKYKGVGTAYTGVVNSGTITQADFDNAEVDITAIVQEEGTLRRTLWVPNCYLTSFSINIPIDGPATQSYDFVGDCDYDLLGRYADSRVGIGLYNGTTSGFALSGINQALSGSVYSGMYATVDNAIVASGTQITLTSGSSTTTVVWPAATFSGVNSSSRMRLLYYKNAPETFANRKSFAFLGNPTYAAIFARQCDVELWAGNASGYALRVQSLNINGDLSREDLKELGNYRVVSKRLTTPLRITAQLEIAESDLETYARMIGGATWTSFSTYKDTTATGTALFLNSQLLDQPISLRASITPSRSEVANGTGPFLSIITMSGLYVTSKATSASSTGRSSVSVGLQGSYFSISASGSLPAGFSI